MPTQSSLPLVVTDIYKDFNGISAVHGLSFSVTPGEVLGIVGPNGAGKTTTVKMILGLLAPDKGTITLFGQPIESQTVRQRIGYMPETPSFYAHLTGMELLQFVGDLFRLPRVVTKTRSQKLLRQVGLTDAANRYLGTYSKGMLQRICLAQALINEPDLVFLDEPLDGLDPIGRIRMREILLEIKSQGTAIVLNSHILSDVEIMSDKIAIMDRGKMLRYDTVAKLVPKGKTLEEVFLNTIEA